MNSGIISGCLAGVRLKVNVIQTGLAAPVLSNEELETFAPQPDSSGERFWLLSGIDGQQIWSAAGRTFVVRRELTFESYEVNPPAAAFFYVFHYSSIR